MKRVILALTILTGFSGLVFQVIWQRYFSYFLGGEAFSSALVISIFLGGLSAGYSVFGKLGIGRSEKQVLRLAGLAELGIGIYSLVFPLVFQVLWEHAYLLPTNPNTRSAFDILITTVLLLPSTILMGSTIPLLTQGLSSQSSDLSKTHSRVYGLNTLGAFFGAIISGFLLIRWIGLGYSMIGLSSFNFISGLVMIIFSKRLPDTKPTISLGQSENGPPIRAARIPRIPMGIAFLAGFVSIGCEVIFIRSVNLAIGSSEYSYSMVVGVFVLMIAIGTLSLGWKSRPSLQRLVGNQIGVVVGLWIVFLTVPYWGWLSYVVGESVPSDFLIYYVCIFATYAAIIAVPVFFMGRTLPLLFAFLESKISNAAQDVSRIYAANTIGCCLGGLTMGYVLLLYFNADLIYKLGIVLSCLSLILISLLHPAQSLKKWMPGGIGIILGLIAVVSPHWSEALMTAGLFRAHRMLPVAFSDPRLFFQAVEDSKKVVLYRDDPNLNISVLEWPSGIRSLYVNGKSDGSTAVDDIRTTRLLGHLPGLFATPNGSAGVVGLGLGTTAFTIAEYPNIERVEIFEIARAVISAQSLFASVNGNVLNNSKITIHQADAFRGLISSADQFAAITAESSNPWVAGSDRLYSEEFYRAVSNKLLPGGVFAQWMHTYEMSVETFAMVLNTFHTAFPYVLMFSNSTDLIMVGKVTPWTIEDWDRAEKRWANLNVGRQMSDVGINSLDALRNHLVQYDADLSSIPIHSLFKPKLSFAAGEDFFYGRSFALRPSSDGNQKSQNSGISN